MKRLGTLILLSAFATYGFTAACSGEDTTLSPPPTSDSGQSDTSKIVDEDPTPEVENPPADSGSTEDAPKTRPIWDASWDGPDGSNGCTVTTNKTDCETCCSSVYWTVGWEWYYEPDAAASNAGCSCKAKPK